MNRKETSWKEENSTENKHDILYNIHRHLEYIKSRIEHEQNLVPKFPKATLADLTPLLRIEEELFGLVLKI